MPRPATIACRRCNDTVTVRERGPVPTFCPQCRARARRVQQLRPASVACTNCGAEVEVKPRGPLPTRCRGTCGEPVRVPTRSHRNRTTDVVPHDPARPAEAEPASQPASRPTAPADAPATRLDVAAEAQRLAAPNHGLYVRLSRVRQVLAIGLWFVLALVVVLLFLLGSQPSAPELESFNQ